MRPGQLLQPPDKAGALLAGLAAVLTASSCSGVWASMVHVTALCQLGSPCSAGLCVGHYIGPSPYMLILLGVLTNFAHIAGAGSVWGDCAAVVCFTHADPAHLAGLAVHGAQGRPVPLHDGARTASCTATSFPPPSTSLHHVNDSASGISVPCPSAG